MKTKFNVNINQLIDACDKISLKESNLRLYEELVWLSKNPNYEFDDSEYSDLTQTWETEKESLKEKIKSTCTDKFLQRAVYVFLIDTFLYLKKKFENITLAEIKESDDFKELWENPYFIYAVQV